MLKEFEKRHKKMKKQFGKKYYLYLALCMLFSYSFVSTFFDLFNLNTSFFIFHLFHYLLAMLVTFIFLYKYVYEIAFKK